MSSYSPLFQLKLVRIKYKFMPCLSPRSPKRNKAQINIRHRKRLKTRKIFDGCNRDNHDVIMFDKSDIDAIDDQSKTWPGYVEPKLSGLDRLKKYSG